MRIKFYEFLGKRIRPVELTLLIKFLFRIRRTVYFLPDSRKYLIDPISDLGIHLQRNNSYDIDMSNRLKQILQDEDCFIDLGSNEGYFAVLAAKLCGQKGKIYAIEPQQRLWPVILHNSVINKLFNIHLIPFGIGSKEQKMKLQLSPSVNSGSSSFSSKFHLKISFSSLRRRIYGSQEVLITTLDILSNIFPSKVKLVKIDIEGYEYEALKGATKMLEMKTVECFLIEIHPSTLNGMNQSENDIDFLLDSYGYEKEKINDYLNLYSLSPIKNV